MKPVLAFILIFYGLLHFQCSESSQQLFQDIPASQSGIDFRNVLKETKDFNVLTYSYFYNGGGVAIGDLNNDGLPDIYFTGNLVASHLYLNQGAWKFKEVAEVSGVAASGLWNTGVTMADVNDDGRLDIYVCRSAAAEPDARRNLLFINQGVDSTGQLNFNEAASRYGLDDPAYSSQAAFFDYDRDGDLDMFLLNHSVPEYSNFSNQLFQLKRRESPHYGDKLYENQNGFFQDVSEKAGIIRNVLGFGLGVAIADVNYDGWQDIYVSNDFNEEDYLYLNAQDGTFKESLRDRISYTSLFSMGSDIGDINNDGFQDIVSLDMLPDDPYRIKMTSGADNYDKYQLLLRQGFYHQSMRNMLQLNTGDGTFYETGQMAGVSNSDWSWSALIADYDLDGWQDIFVTNGYLRDYTNMDFLAYAVDQKTSGKDLNTEEQISEVLQKMPKILVSNKFYKNIHGDRFVDSTGTWFQGRPSMSNGAAYADLDNDGDLDLVVNNVNETASLLRNLASEKVRGNFLKLKFSKSGPSPIGTTVYLHAQDRVFTRSLMPTRGFQSSVEDQLHFGLGDVEILDSLVVRWPDGKWEIFEHIQINTLLIVQKNTGSGRSTTQPGKPIFTKNELINYHHRENAFNDFDFQGLIPRKYSRQGPPIIVHDFDLDGRQDIWIGGGANQLMTLYYGDASSVLTRFDMVPADAAFEDVASALVDADSDGLEDIVVASGGNHQQAGNEDYQVRLYHNRSRGEFARKMDFPDVRINANVCVTGDVDHDGDKDIFVAGMYQARQFPLAAGHCLFINDGTGNFDTIQISGLDTRIAAAQICDVDADGKNELVVGGPWEYIEVWSATGSGWKQRYRSPQRGWYHSLHCVNLDEDEALEIVAGNIGLNNQYARGKNAPVYNFYNDFDENGTIDPILAVWDKALYPLVSRDDLTAQLPELKKQFVSYQDYAQTSMSQLSALLPNPMIDTIETLETMLLDLDTETFRQINLPWRIQSSPVYAIMPIDINGDGQRDLVLAGNDSHHRVKIGEMRANMGVVLVNRGDLSFDALSPWQTGLRIRGDVRSMAEYQSTEKNYLIFGINDGEVEAYSYVLALPNN